MQQLLWVLLAVITALIKVLSIHNINMFIKTTAIILSSTALSIHPEQQEFYLDGDYTEVARIYYQDYNTKTFDPNEILYQEIIKEIIDSKHKLEY